MIDGDLTIWSAVVVVVAVDGRAMLGAPDDRSPLRVWVEHDVIFVAAVPEIAGIRLVVAAKL